MHKLSNAKTCHRSIAFENERQIQLRLTGKNQEGFPYAEVGPGSAYLANKTFESLNEMFESSQTIQNWLTECSNVISGSFEKCVAWETPLGLSVVQPYMKIDIKESKLANRAS